MPDLPHSTEAALAAMWRRIYRLIEDAVEQKIIATFGQSWRGGALNAGSVTGTLPPSVGFGNPMTAEGSLIQGGVPASGVAPAAELKLGTAGQFPGPVGSDVAWITPVDASGLADQTTTDNDLIYRKKTSVTSLVIGFIGDSITLNTPSGGNKPPTNCVTDLSVNGLTVTASNQGVSGTSTSDWLPASTNLVNAKAAFASAGVRLVHIMLGTNDARVAVRNSATTFQSNLQSIVSDLVGAGYIVAISYPPYCVPGSNAGDQDATANTLRIAYQAKINQIVNGSTVRQADTSAYQYFSTHSSELSDGIHPTATGSVDLATLWANGLQRVVDALTQQTTLQRLTLGTNLSITTGVLNASGGSPEIDHNGTTVGTRSKINLIDGNAITLTVADNSGAGRVDVTIAGVGEQLVQDGTSAPPVTLYTEDGTDWLYAG